MFDEETRRGIASYCEIAKGEMELISAITAASHKAIPGFAGVLPSVTGQPALQANRDNILKIERGALHDDWEPYVESLRMRGTSYATAGADFTAWSTAYRLILGRLIDFVFTRFDDKEQLRVINKGLAALFDLIVQVVGETFFASQHAAIRELSTPVLVAADRTLLVPLVGALDDTRMRDLIAKLLAAVRDQRARAVVIDLTGVATVDSASMGHLGHIVSSASLMGARVILSGLAPDVCKALVTLGIETPNAETVATLDEALRSAVGPRGFLPRRVG